MRLTQEQIDALPRPLKPIRDTALCIRVGQKKGETKIGSIYLPDTQSTIEDQVVRVLETGDGLMLDDGIIRKCPVKRGDLCFVTPKDGFRLVLNGDEFWVYEAMEIVGIFLDESVSAYGNETCLNE